MVLSEDIGAGDGGKLRPETDIGAFRACRKAWAAQFLPPEDDAAAEAAIAIAQTHTSEAFKLLSAVFAKARDPWFRTAVLSALALTRQQQATDWLLDLIANEQSHAADAQEALCRTAPSVATLDRLKQLGRPCI